MRFDYLRQPVSDDQPAGPDLEEEMDNDYMNYTLVAGGRMPSSFFIRAGDGTLSVFDRTTIDANSEMASIDELLARSKDARLVVLAAQFQALAGSIDGFCDAVAGAHILCTEFWDTFYPRESDGDFTVRQNVLEGFDDQVHVVLPLQYAPIAGTSRLQQVTLRGYQIAQGKADPREGEETASLGALGNTLSHDSTKEQLLELHAKVAAAIVQLEDIDKAFLAHDAGTNMPSFGKVVDVLKQIVELIATNRPELIVARAADEEALDEEAGSDSGAAPELKGKVKTHGQAKAALGAVERYLLMMEPSNPAMILVHQARMLFGRPLVEALDALMPDSARRAVFRFDAGMSFEIDISRMRSVSEHAMSDDNDIAATIPAAASTSTSASAAAATPEYGPDVELDAWGQPIDRSAPPPPRLDAWGQPIVDTPAPAGPRLDAWGQPIVEDAAPAVRLDAWGQPIAEDAAPAVRLDAWGQPIVDAGPPPRLDAWGQPIVEDAPPAAPAPEAAPAPAAAEEPATTPPAAAPAPVKPPPSPPPPETVFVVTTRGQASDLIQAVEGFFRQAEPSSSLPILLAKARGYLNRDFASILSELIPRLPDGS